MVKPINKATIAGYLIRIFRLSTFLRRAYSIAIKTEFGRVDSNVVLEIGKYFKKARSLGAHMIRLGSANDGGYVVFQDFDLSDVCLSFGIGDNNSFDFAVSSLVEIVKMYDHTVDSPPLKFENGDFYRIGISHVAQPGFMTVRRILEETPPEKEVVLKIDIEGSEWAIFKNLEQSDLSRFKQIVGELHGFHKLLKTPEGQELMHSVLSKLTCSHTFVNLHANNWGKTDLIQGFLIPDVLEFTLVRDDRLPNNVSNTGIPQVLNQPNNPNEPEIYLGFLSQH